MDFKKFYIETGKLGYAIAKADGKVNHKEASKMNDIIKDEVTLLGTAIGFNEKDENLSAALEFELLMKKNVSSQDAYESFI